jgi:hypothetical protein
MAVEQKSASTDVSRTGKRNRECKTNRNCGIDGITPSLQN